MTLQAWQRALIEHGELYRVGGAVRDEMMGLVQAEEDVDYLVSGIPPKKLEEILAPHGRVMFVGKAFGVYKFKPTGGTLEHDIAFPRRETSTGPGHRHFDVDWGEDVSLESDLGRRDFTMNAIAQNVADGRIVDLFGGRADIARKRLRMIFPEAFREDSLRILRGVRFAARFSLHIEAATFEAMRVATPLVKALSAERVQEELSKVLSQCVRPSEAFSTMHALGVLSIVLPELDRGFGVTQNEYHPDDVFWHSLKSCDEAPQENLLVRWAALLHDVGKIDAKRVVVENDSAPRVVFYGHEEISGDVAEKVLTRLRYSNDFVDRCVHLIRLHMYYYQPEWNRATVRRFIRRVGEENLDDLFQLRRADLLSRGLAAQANEIEELRRRVFEEIEADHALRIEDLAIDGHDVMAALGLPAGRRVGAILKELFDKVIDNPSLNTRKTLIDMLGEYKGLE